MTTVTYPDTTAKNKESVDAKQMINQKAHRMTFEMDKRMHSKLKMASASEGIYIKDILTQATREWLSTRGYL
jgi:hypothetical protein